MQAELARLGSGQILSAQLAAGAKGAIAQGKKARAALAEGGSVAVAGDVEGDVTLDHSRSTVDQRNQQVTQQTNVAGDMVVNPPPPDPAEKALAALGGQEGTEEELTLDQVYIDLDTRSRVPLTEAEKQARQSRGSDDRPLTAREAFAQTPRLALLGDPGSGKSTFGRLLLGWQAAVQLGETGPPPGGAAGLLPVLLTLRDLTPALADLSLDGLPAQQQQARLLGLVRDQLTADLTRFEAAAFAEGLIQAVSEGQCLLLLDGLDEVPQDLRLRVRQVVAALTHSYHPARLILTCRTRSYVGEAVLPGFTAHSLAPFDETKIGAFAQGWYAAQTESGRFDPETAARKGHSLAQAATGPDLRELAANPMLLTTMALIHQREIGLPRERVRLYNLAVDVLLHRWQKHNVGQLAPAPALTAFLTDQLRLRRTMERLAYEAHQVGRDQKEAADLPRGLALTLLEAPEYLGDPGLAAEFLDYVDQRAGLLVGRGGDLARPTAYSVPHRTVQEYLAGCTMIGRRDV